ncbi:MAG: hypothetical protein V1745_03505 [Patescibacteria group bacterium]
MKKTPPGSKGYLALFATFLVVGGVVGVAYLGSQSKGGPAKQTPSIQVPTSTRASGVSLLVVDGRGSRIVENGTERSATWPDDTNLLGTPLSTLVGRKVLTGEPAYLLPEFVLATSSAGIRSPDGRRSLHPSPSRKDGAGVIEVRNGSESHAYVLRATGGRAVKDVAPVGWWDSETMAATGFVTSSRILFSVSLSGDVEQVAFLPDTISMVRADHGSVWYVAVQPGEGLESAPLPPSSLHRVQREGTNTVVAEETSRVILNFVMFVDMSKVAYATDDGQITVVSEGTTTSLGLGVPLGILDDGRVLLLRDSGLFVVDPATRAEERAADAPGDDGAVFLIVPPVVDGTP